MFVFMNVYNTNLESQLCFFFIIIVNPWCYTSITSLLA